MKEEDAMALHGGVRTLVSSHMCASTFVRQPESYENNWKEDVFEGQRSLKKLHIQIPSWFYEFRQVPSSQICYAQPDLQKEQRFYFY